MKFKDLEVGDKFISKPIFRGDKVHGEVGGPHYIFIKIHGIIGGKPAVGKAVRLRDGWIALMSFEIEVLKVE